MKIISVTKKDDKTVIVHLDNTEKLYLSYEVFMKNSLRKNDEISEGFFALLIKENQRYFIKQKTFNYLNRRLHSSNELRMKLKQKKYNAILVEEVINELIENKYLDDYNFALQYSDEQIRNKLWGKNKIKAELFKRGVSKEIIEQIISEKFPEGNRSVDALELLKKKYKSLQHRNLEPEKLEEKLIAFLFSRGYDYETSKHAVDVMFKKPGLM